MLLLKFASLLKTIKYLKIIDNIINYILQRYSK